jgi:hypothetical protein
MVIELSQTFKILLAHFTTSYTGFLRRLAFERLCKLPQMHTREMNETIPLSNILIVASLTRALESLFGFQRLRMTRLHMHIQKTLLKKSGVTHLTCMRKCAFMLLQMVVHRRLIPSRVLTVLANIGAILILLILENHSTQFVCI